ncbi:hypothetical protein KM043_005111 [Ampulex compressa]|nr:hypothetical protein KM043_005111 [Ampulex compressa]
MDCRTKPRVALAALSALSRHRMCQLKGRKVKHRGSSASFGSGAKGASEVVKGLISLPSSDHPVLGNDALTNSGEGLRAVKGPRRAIDDVRPAGLYGSKDSRGLRSG